MGLASALRDECTWRDGEQHRQWAWHTKEVMKLVGLDWRDVWERKGGWGHKRGAYYGGLPRTNKRVKDIKYFLCARPSAEHAWLVPPIPWYEGAVIDKKTEASYGLLVFTRFCSIPWNNSKKKSHTWKFVLVVYQCLFSLRGRKC